jgi:hypothetical protein
MINNFRIEYSERSDDELLHLASERHSLTTEAADALDVELRRRNLTESDRIEHQRFVKRQEQRETAPERRRRKKITAWKDRLTFGALKDRLSWRDLLWAFAAMAMISFTYIALPSRYHMNSEWQDAAFIVMMTSVLIAIASRSVFWRKFTFWMSLLISSAIDLLIVHAWTKRAGDLGRGVGKLATLLGFFLFFAVYGFVRLLQRMFHRQEDQRTDSGDGHVLE